MEVKTYSRARSAVAAAKKALGHLEAFISRWEATAWYDSKFTCEVTIRSGGGKEIVDAVKAAGFIPNVTMVAETVDDFDTATSVLAQADFDKVEAAVMAEAAENPALTELLLEGAKVLTDEDEDDAEDEEGEKSEADEIIEAEGGDPLPTDAPRKKGGYINEHSNVMGACELARSIAQSMPDAPRKDVIAACRQAGIAYGTARPQLQKVRGGK